MQFRSQTDSSPIRKWLSDLVGLRPTGEATSLGRLPVGLLGAMPSPQMIPEAEVSDVTIANVLSGCHITFRPGAGNVLHCTTLGGMNFHVSVRDRLKLIHLCAIASGGDMGDRGIRGAVAGTINNEVVFGRAAIDTDGDFVMDCAVSYCGGLIPQQLTHTIAVLERAFMDSKRFMP